MEQCMAPLTPASMVGQVRRMLRVQIMKQPTLNF